MPGMGRSRQVGLITDDLIFQSQIEGPVTRHGAMLAVSSSDFLPPESELIFVDLNREADARLEYIRNLRRENAEAVIVGFCEHENRATRIRGMENGASQVVTNRWVATVADRLLSGMPSDSAFDGVIPDAGGDV